VEDCAAAVHNLEFSDAELANIDSLVSDAGINLWKQSSDA